MYEMHFGIPMCGAILNTINIRLDSRTISVLLRHSDSKLVFVDIQSRSLIEQAVKSLTNPPRLIIIEDEYENGGRVEGDNYGGLTYERMIEKGDPGFEWVRPKSEWSPMILNYTSGTTSSPKGVVHSHRGIFIITVDSLIDWMGTKQPVYLWNLPMFHGNG
ncbi:putative acyl-activating enzyme 5, peroxisomal [Cinnamomum micranthum f. kanehirae]|uniref:Putative acyl-activating enzyme 5, peroxisomal n=1 Tax=Cinnamomum micranthum f. kanehirae TaxID=337451 RepID=A0A443NJQ8_9MAGN|nr:putative acyl-activating enzyme 5, peroxisomal [Cinnamomum micranthum f. kanehirae]